MNHTMQAVVGASAAPLRVPGVPVAPQGPVGQGLQGPGITAEALEDLGWRILAQESQGVHLPSKEGGKAGANGAGRRGLCSARSHPQGEQTLLLPAEEEREGKGGWGIPRE